MTATALAVVPRNRAVLYDGTNSGDIDALITDFAIISESGGSIVIESGGGQHTCPIGGFFVFNEAGTVYDVIANQSAFDGRFHVMALAAEVEALGVSIDSLPAVVGAAGAATFSGLLSLGTTVVPVTITPAMPDTGYTPHATVFGSPTILGNIDITDIDVVDEDTVNVTIENTSLGLLGGTVMVVAIT